jgi:hypothetical protein
MPTVLKVLNLIFIIHTRDHGYPHVTVYRGTPKNHDAFAKVRLDEVQVMELHGFKTSAERIILEIVSNNQADWLEVWNETRETK